MQSRTKITSTNSFLSPFCWDTTQWQVKWRSYSLLFGHQSIITTHCNQFILSSKTGIQFTPQLLLVFTCFTCCFVFAHPLPFQFMLACTCLKMQHSIPVITVSILNWNICFETGDAELWRLWEEKKCSHCHWRLFFGWGPYKVNMFNIALKTVLIALRSSSSSITIVWKMSSEKDFELSTWYI